MSLNRPVHGGNVVWAASVAGCSPDRLLDFSASINPLGPPQSAIAAITTHLNRITLYPDPRYSELRKHLGRFHQLPPEMILPGNGAAELLTWIARQLRECQRVYVLTPAFRDYARALQAFGVPIQPYPLDWSKLASSLPLSPNPGSGVLLNNPHNPTGKLWRREEILPLLDRFEWVVIDEAFMDFLDPSEDQSLIPLIQEYPHLVIVRSLTKFYSLPGLRLGYAIADPAWIAQWEHWRDPWPVNILAEVAGIAAIGDRDFQRQTWDWLPPTREDLLEGLRSLPGFNPYPGAANFLLVNVDRSVTELQEWLLKEHQILIRDCTSFPELGDRYFRIAVRSQAENQRLLSALGDR
ncbi:threonine-phosphate decarboxylase CobD [Roseofilum capinflatum]|uniref:threonine-phosphate decarboxylase n=1 Tax=Roseofilum capinflatum BLCC-M114 TaxID=3022440 RepID=A0ABT7B9M0_9CYAN|nr:threonine-phosphate decarboxylase CobD [Roseofilum capinflatum]MDJ1175309.1 threonine-phosphate decarboxylase CobD [Roseofilum capinflatum BLCC-M114]